MAGAEQCDTAEEANVCAICFETVSERTVLPCACNVDYCHRCWDHALAASFNAGDHARCPTCRTPVHVDFDSNTCCLVFSREAPEHAEMARAERETIEEMERLRVILDRLRVEDGGTQERTAIERRYMALAEQAEGQSQARAEHYQETVERLAAQAIPAMTRNLQRYLTANAVLMEDYYYNPVDHLTKLPASKLKAEIAHMGGNSEGCLEKSDITQRLVDVADSPGKVASFLASAVLEAPACVCGSSLERLDSRERTRQMLQHAGFRDIGNMEEAVDSFLANGHSNCICDVCDEGIENGSCVWACKNKASTILHATTYDVCDSCFIRHACFAPS